MASLTHVCIMVDQAAPPPLFRLALTKSGWRAGAARQKFGWRRRETFPAAASAEFGATSCTEAHHITFDELCDAADDELLGKAPRLSNDIMRALLPPPSSTASLRFDLRHRTHPHSLQLPEHSTYLSDCDCLTRMLYTN